MNKKRETFPIRSNFFGTSILPHYENKIIKNITLMYKSDSPYKYISK